MAYVEHIPSRFETYKDANGVVNRYFTAGYIVDDVLGQKYSEYWIEGADLAALPPDDALPQPNARFIAIVQLTNTKALQVHAQWVSASLNQPPTPIIRSPAEMEQIAAIMRAIPASGSI